MTQSTISYIISVSTINLYRKLEAHYKPCLAAPSLLNFYSSYSSKRRAYLSSALQRAFVVFISINPLFSRANHQLAPIKRPTKIVHKLTTFQSIKALFSLQKINGQNPVHLALTNRAYRIQSRILQIPDLCGFFSSSPPPILSPAGCGLRFYNGYAFPDNMHDGVRCLCHIPRR